MIRHTPTDCPCGLEHQPRNHPTTCTGCRTRTTALNAICDSCWDRRVAVAPTTAPGSVEPDFPSPSALGSSPQGDHPHVTT